MPHKDPQAAEAYHRAYRARPGVKAKKKQQGDSSEAKAVAKAWRSTPERRAQMREYYARPENKAKALARARAYQARPEVREKKLAYGRSLARKHDSRRRTYGLTAALHAAVMAAQSGNCGFCCAPFVDGEKICVDHTHDAHEYVRGIVHNACNIFLGHLDARDIQHPYRSLPPAYAVGRINRKGFVPSLSYAAAVFK